MPINDQNYPENWTDMRKAVLERAQNRCEQCNVHNYAIVQNINKKYVPIGGNLLLDLAGDGCFYPSANCWNYQDGVKFRDEMNETICDSDTPKYILVVLTVAHLDHDADNKDVKLDRLKAMCQCCHLQYDAPYKAQKRKEKKLLATQQSKLF